MPLFPQEETVNYKEFNGGGGSGGYYGTSKIEPSVLNVTIRSKDKVHVRIPLSTEFRELGHRLSYVVRNRRRWNDDRMATERVEKQIRSDVGELGINLTSEEIAAIGEAGLVEVSIPWTDARRRLDACNFPWEFVLSAIGRIRGRGPLTVVRHLDHGAIAEPSSVTPQSALLVASGPGEIGETYTFKSELRLVKSRLRIEGDSCVTMTEATRMSLKKQVSELQPEVIHLTGCDNGEGAELLGLKGQGCPDGLVLTGPTSNSGDLVDGADLAIILNSAQRKPRLVACNFWNSGSYTSPHIVAAGAESAIGFRDEFAAELGDLFYSEFYNAYFYSDGNAAQAFRLALDQLRGQARGLRGACIIYWSARSIFQERARLPAAEAKIADAPPRRRRGRPAGATEQGPRIDVVALGTRPATQHDDEEIRTAVRNASNIVLVLGEHQHPNELLSITVKPQTRLNYSMLHNSGGLFDYFKFEVIHPGGGIVRDIDVDVRLFLGGESEPFRARIDVINQRDLAPHIRVPLTSAMGRSLREGVQTTLAVNVKWSGRVAYCDTFPVTLLAVDEWRDDDLNREWLPSFVLSRDPMVAKIVTAASRYLKVLCDDSGAGFYGYDSDAIDDSGRADDVDIQVQSLWFSLLHDLPLGYINPPPTFTESSQRLRTPSDVVGGGRGTCIDLTLLMSACLEYLDIRPVIFLIKGHAFPGYWRSEDAHRQFKEAHPPDFAMSDAPKSNQKATPRKSWYLDKPFYEEIREYVEKGLLVPLETVWLTHRGSFWDAIDEGVTNLRDKNEFDALIDIRRARDEGVTPLPLIQKEGVS